MKRSKLFFAILSVYLIAIFLTACIPNGVKTQKTTLRKQLLKNARTWMYQIQDLDKANAISKLKKTNYDILVVDPTRTVKGSEDFDTKTMVKQLHNKSDGKRRIVLAYIDIGEAEDYRTYWRKSWRPPSVGKRGSPSFIIAPDPDGWSGNYPVAYWDKRWKEIWLGREGIIQSLTKDGFDGVYLDWVEAYMDEKVVAVAKEEKVKPAKEMVGFIKDLKARGQKIIPGFQVVAQNAPYLIDKDREYAKIIDAIAVEDTWFRGEANSNWNNPNGGDIANDNTDDWSTKSLIKQYRKYQRAGLPVFSVDYCLDKRNATSVYRLATKQGMIPLVTRVSLSKITQTPPLKF